MIESAAPLPDDAPDPAVLRAERRLLLLEELAEIGMELARALKPRPVADPAHDDAARVEHAATDPATAKGRDPAEVFAPLSRAIRLTLALEAKTDADLCDLKAGVTRAREAERAQAAERAAAAAANARKARLERVGNLVLGAAECETEDEEVLADVLDAVELLLDREDAEFDCAGRSLRETVERLCADLGFTPDWSRWTGEGWIDDEPLTRRPVRASGAPAVGLAPAAGGPAPQTPIPVGHALE